MKTSVSVGYAKNLRQKIKNTNAQLDLALGVLRKIESWPWSDEQVNAIKANARIALERMRKL